MSRISLLLNLFVLASCSADSNEKVYKTYPGLESREGYYYKEGTDVPFTGSTESNYDNGVPLVQANFKEGKLHGTYTAYYANGHKMGTSNYKRGVQQGESTAWHENGNKASEAYYADGLKHGKFRTYYSSGDLMIEAFYWEDELDSTFTQWDMSGNIILVEEYNNGFLEFRHTNENGESEENL